MSLTVVLVAAGTGSRFRSRSPHPKQFELVGGRPLLHWPLRTLQNLPAVGHLVVVTQARYVTRVRTLVRRGGFRKVAAVVPGGKERADSVAAGIGAVPAGTTHVLIHDAARALVPKDVVQRVIAGTRRTGAALAAWPVPDTLKSETRRRGRSLVGRTVPRAGLWLAQTPQGLRLDLAQQLVQKRRQKFTDDVQWAEKAGHPVELVLGSSRNFKVTLREDLELCRALVPAPKKKKK